MTPLETRLGDLGAHLEFPPEPDVASAVRAHLEQPGAERARPPREQPRPWRIRRRLHPALAAALAVVLAATTVLAVSPSARSTVLEWLGLKGVEIERRPADPTPAPSPAPTPYLGREVTLAEARDLVRYRIVAPPEAPDAVFYDQAVPDGAITMRFGDRLLTQFRGRTNSAFIRKAVGPGTAIERVQVDGRAGFWLAGAAHELVYVDADGIIRADSRRLAANTLLWLRGDLTLRLEGPRDKGEALAFARSVR